MSISTDAAHFFQSSAAQATATRKAAKAQNNTAGNPIKLDSKILAVLADPSDEDGRRVFVAESAGVVRRLRIPDAGVGEKGDGVDVGELCASSFPASLKPLVKPQHGSWGPTTSQSGTGSSTNSSISTLYNQAYPRTRTPQPKHTYRGPTSPLTSLTLSTTNHTLFAGSWDKSIWSWSISTRKPLRRYQGHGDFVKAVLCACTSAPRPTTADPATPPAAAQEGRSRELLISGSADATLIIWDVDTGARLAVVRDTGRILCLAIDPSSFRFPDPFGPAKGAAADGNNPELGGIASTPPSGFVLYSAASDPEVRRWRISAVVSGASHEADDGGNGGLSIEELEIPQELKHETSVNSLTFTPRLQRWPMSATELPHEELEDEGNKLFTASSDNSARSLTMSVDAVAAAGNGEGATKWTPDLRLEHPDFVRAVVVDEKRGLVVTACRDEDVRVWDAGSGRLVHTWRGHYEEVTDLALVRGADGKGREVVSVSIDGTVRCWSLDPGMMGEARRREEESGEVVGGVREEKKGPELTEDEERELAELMDDDD